LAAFIGGFECDAEGNCYSTGSFIEELTFPDTVVTTPEDGYSSTFIMKYDTDGNRQWINIESGINGIDLELAENHLYAYGSVGDYIGEFYVPQSNGFIAKLDNLTGNYLWVKAVGYLDVGNKNDIGSLAIDEDENIFILNNWEDNKDFIFDDLRIEDPDENGSSVIVLDQNGEFKYLRPVIPSGKGYGIAAKNNKIYVGGRTFSAPYSNESFPYNGSFYLHTFTKQDYEINFESVVSNGVCLTDSIDVLLNSDTFLANNDFYINFYINYLPSIYPPVSTTTPITLGENQTTIDSARFLPFLGWIRENSYFRVCSTLPSVCTDLIWIGIPELKGSQPLLCYGDTIGLKIDDRMEDILWLTDSNLNIVSADSVDYFPDIDDTLSVSAVHPIGCTFEDQFSVEVPQIINPLAQDSIFIDCNSPLDTVKYKIAESNLGSGYSYSWSPNYFISGFSTQVTFSPPKDTTYQLLTTHPSGCQRSDSLVVIESGCKILKGEIKHLSSSTQSFDNSRLDLLRLDNLTNRFERIKSFVVEEGQTEFQFRTSDPTVFLKAEPIHTSLFSQFFPTYADSSYLSLFIRKYHF